MLLYSSIDSSDEREGETLFEGEEDTLRFYFCKGFIFFPPAYPVHFLS